MCSIDESKPIISFGTVPFLSGVYKAYCSHCPLSFSPDDFWLLILQGFSNHINSNAEKLRYLFVNFEGKKNLKASLNKTCRDEMTKVDYEDAISQLVGQIPNYVDKNLIQALEPDFSITTKNIKYVGCLSIMCCFKKYFNYEMNCYACGIPSITLKGTLKDWEKILIKTESLKNKQLDWWINEIIHIIKKIKKRECRS